MFKGSMVAIVTPMNEDGSLDHLSLENLIEFHIENKTDVIISVGTTGESATLDFNEHSEVIKSTLAIVNKGYLWLRVLEQTLRVKHYN